MPAELFIVTTLFNQILYTLIECKKKAVLLKTKLNASKGLIKGTSPKKFLINSEQDRSEEKKNILKKF